MGDYNVIADVGRVLIKLLWESIKEDELVNEIIGSYTQISLSSPDELGADESISVFLYQVTEDSFQKNQGMQISTSNMLENPPIFLNLHYLITACTKSGENDDIVMGKVIHTFNSNRILRGTVLQGTALDGESLNLIFNSMSLEDLNKIWTVLSKSKPYKLGAFYEVSPVAIDSAGGKTFSRVQQS
jgi:hypothetical protein